MLSEVLLAETSRSKQLVERFLLVCLFTATLGPEKGRMPNNDLQCVCSDLDPLPGLCSDLLLFFVPLGPPGVLLSDDLQHTSDHVTNSGL